jgi:hypothetical protein
VTLPGSRGRAGSGAASWAGSEAASRAGSGAASWAGSEAASRAGSGAWPGVALARAGLAILRRPALWPAVARLVPARWWRRWPPFPWPPPDYVRFRIETMYGANGRIDPDDLVRYLEWCRRMGRSAR